jgi:RHS repeat-associated protein
MRREKSYATSFLIKCPNGTRQRLQYDAAHRLTAAFEERGATTLWHAAYTYTTGAGGGSGEIPRTRNPKGKTSGSERVNCHNAHRLTNAAITPMPKPFAPAPATMTYDVDNRLATYNGQAVSSDLDGNMLAAPLHGTLLGNLTWDARNRLVAAGNTSYAYDAEDRRTSRTIAGSTTAYTWSRGAVLDRLLATSNPDGSTTRYVHGLGLLYEETEPAGSGAPTVRTYHYNWQGSTIALTDASGNVTARMAYSAYGEVTIEGGSGFQLPTSLPTPFLFNGQFGVLTEPNGLYAMQARFYSPVFRRFLSEDPAGFAGGINLYAYANGDPVNLMDPFGLGPVRNSFFSGLAGAFGNFARDAYYGVGDVAIGSIGLPLALASYVGGYGLGAVGVPNHLIGQGDAIMANLSPYANAGYYDPNSPTSLTVVAGSLFLPVKMLPRTAGPRVPTQPFYRYVGEGEAAAIRRTGLIPNADQFGNPKTVYFTERLYETAGRAKSFNQLPSKPTFRIEIAPANVPNRSPFARIEPSANPQWGLGGGVEATTLDAIRVDPSTLTRLRGAP